MTADVDAWIAALQTRHRGAFTNAEFLKAVRALSARYVERRHALADRSPLDSAAKRAAFAAFYGPLHLLTVINIASALGEAADAGTIVDLGCGTGVASAGWALGRLRWRDDARESKGSNETSHARPARISAVDVHAWAIDEAVWTWRTLGLDGRARRADVLAARLDVVPSRSGATAGETFGVIAGWSVNELDNATRSRLLTRLLDAASSGAHVLIVEPIGNHATPWWPEWTDRFATRGGRADQWRFADALPPLLAELDEAAGFRRDGLSAKSLFLRIGPD